MPGLRRRPDARHSRAEPLGRRRPIARSPGASLRVIIVRLLWPANANKPLLRK